MAQSKNQLLRACFKLSVSFTSDQILWGHVWYWRYCQVTTYFGLLSQNHEALQRRHNEHDGVSNHQPYDCLLNRLIRRRSKKALKLCVTGLCVGNSPVTGEFPAQRASNAQNVSIWWRHHGVKSSFYRLSIYVYVNALGHYCFRQWLISCLYYTKPLPCTMLPNLDHWEQIQS